MTIMFDLIIVVSAVFAAAVMYAAVIAMLTFLENSGLCQKDEKLCKKNESSGKDHI